MKTYHKIVVFIFCLLPVLSFAREDFMHPFAREVQDVVYAYFAKTFALQDSNLVVEYSLIDTTLCVIKYDAIKVLPSRQSARKGVQMLKCGLFSKGELKSSFNLKVRVKTFQTVVVTKGRLKLQELINPGNVELAWRETTKIRPQICTKIGEVLNKRATRVIQAGEIFTENMVENLPLIPNGSRIKIYFNNRGVEVVMPGIARQDGHKGNKVLVKCPANSRSYTAVVIDEKSVRVDL